MAEAKVMNIYQKLAKVRKQVEVIQKNKSGYNYKYVSEDKILARISGNMDKYNLSLIPSVIHGSRRVEPYHTTKTRTTKSGEWYEEQVNEVLVSADMVFTWVNNDNPDETVVVPWVLVGHQADASQSFGSGLSYSMRYFLLKFFNIATPDDDPDKFRSEQRAASQAEDKAVAAEIVGTIDSSVKAFLEKNPKKQAEVKKFMEQYVKDGNYFKIEEPSMAAKLLQDFDEQFLKEE